MKLQNLNFLLGLIFLFSLRNAIAGKLYWDDNHDGDIEGYFCTLKNDSKVISHKRYEIPKYIDPITSQEMQFGKTTRAIPEITKCEEILSCESYTRTDEKFIFDKWRDSIDIGTETSKGIVTGLNYFSGTKTISIVKVQGASTERWYRKDALTPPIKT